MTLTRRFLNGAVVAAAMTAAGRIGMATADYFYSERTRALLTTLYHRDGRTPYPYQHHALRPSGALTSVRRRNSSTPYENAAARVPPPEKARTTRFSWLLKCFWRV